MSSSSSVATSTVFDMGSEQAVLALLRRIHLSQLPIDTKNELRDLVFSTRFGNVKPVDEAMVATFAAHGFQITASSPIATVTIEDPNPSEENSVLKATPSILSSVTVPSTFGRGRQTPHFAPVEVNTVPPAVVEESAVAAVIQPTPAIAVAPIVPTDLQQTTAAEVEPGAVVPAVPVPPPEEPVVSTVADEHITPAVATVREVAAPSTIVNPSDRIAAIKREVNALVGNPVNLIDVNNDVGREYMNALLDAMKKSLGGTTAQEVERAMSRLERSFVAVKEAVRGTTAVPSSSELLSAAVDAASDSPQRIETTPEPVAPAVGEVVAPASTTAVEAAIDTIAEVQIDEAPAILVPSIPVTPAVAEAETVQAVAIASSKRVPVVSAEAPTEPNSEVITSVAKERQLKELMEARQAAEAADAAKRAAIAANNPLMADDVTSGLHQLLSEWKLFKSSGIFGTGPSGNEHPLYKKINQLTMAAVLAGRFEGANADIKRSITDYMNGWRYEEGVTHEVSETFEHYLRRVIRTILDKQTETVDGR